jgi:GTPase
MVLLSPEAPAVCCQQFEADVYVLYHCNKITKNFQTTVHIGTVCQTAVITHISRVSKSRQEKHLSLWWHDFVS